MSNEVVIRPDTRIGAISAEADDAFLFECFEDHPSLAEITDLSTPRMFLLGGTGSGKTAILRMIEKQSKDCIVFRVHEMAMMYISNSDAIKFLDAIDVKLDFFFQALWRHVICIEYIRLACHVDSEEKSRNIFNNFKEYFSRDSSKKKAVEYLRRWEDKFWITMDEVVKEITQRLENEVSLEMGAEIERFKTRAGFVRGLSSEKKSQLQSRAKKFVESDLLSDLSRVQSILSEYQPVTGGKYYIIIDQLDENWVDSRVRYRLIRALIESLKTLRRIGNLKVLVAMRADLLQRVIRETKDDGFQSEKYQDYFLTIRWTREQLRSLVNKRINYLYRWRYTKQNVFFQDVFQGKVRKTDPFQYIVERSLMRPRDIIEFINTCFETAEGSVSLNQSRVLAAERVYSGRRYDALVDEWIAAYPAIEPCVDLLRARKATFSLSEFYVSTFVDEIFDVLASRESYHADPIFRIVNEESGDRQIHSLVAAIFERLQFIGVVGLKIRAEESYRWSFRGDRPIRPETLTAEVRAQIHPMFHSILGVREV